MKLSITNDTIASKDVAIRLGRVNFMTFPASIEVWLLAQRQVASHPWEFFTKNSVDSIAKSTRPQEDDLRRTVNMECHDGSQRFNAPELMKEALVAVFIVRQDHQSLNTIFFQLVHKIIFSKHSYYHQKV